MKLAICFYVTVSLASVWPLPQLSKTKNKHVEHVDDGGGHRKVDVEGKCDENGNGGGYDRTCGGVDDVDEDMNSMHSGDAYRAANQGGQFKSLLINTIE